MSTPTILRGVITGRTIQLDQETGFAHGQEVFVTIEPAPMGVETERRLPPGEGLRQAFGAWAEDGEELDKYLGWTRQERKGTFS